MINDYPTLQDAVTRWLARSDLAASIPDFILLAEARINADLSLSPQQVQVTGTTSASTITPPADYRQVESLFLTIGGIEMNLHPVSSDKSWNASINTIPDSYWTLGNVININCNTDYPYRLVYYAGVPSLATNTTNWLIQRNPNVYLYATLLEASPYIQDDERINVWGSGYQNAIAALQRQDDHVRFGPSPRMRVDFNAP